MPLNFPVVEDIPLAKAPLSEVICQVRFPTILRIAEGRPVEFQEHIRDRFPILEIERSVIIEMEGLKPGGNVDFVPSVYQFYDREKLRSVGLAPDFYALSTKAYRHWEQFASDLEYVAEAVQADYAIPYATRIGLRYINTIDAAFTSTGNFEDIYELLRPELTVMLRTDVIVSPDHVIQRIHAPSDEGEFTFQYGLIRESKTSKPKFILDFDHYIEGNVDLDDLVVRCDRFHQIIYSAFRWCIADGKLDVFQPLKEV